jgi:DNA-binding HxlR family transcriptional regulator
MGIKEAVLVGLWPDKRSWHRKLMRELRVNDKPLRRILRELVEEGYLFKEPRKTELGSKGPYHLTTKGRRKASRLRIGEAGRTLFLQVLDKLEAISKLPDDEGELVLELALEIVNMLGTEERSKILDNALSKIRVGME